MRDNDRDAAAQQQVREANQLKHDAKQLRLNAPRLADESAAKQINQGFQVSFFVLLHFNLSVFFHYVRCSNST